MTIDEIKKKYAVDAFPKKDNSDADKKNLDLVKRLQNKVIGPSFENGERIARSFWWSSRNTNKQYSVPVFYYRKDAKDNDKAVYRVVKELNKLLDNIGENRAVVHPAVQFNVLGTRVK